MKTLQGPPNAMFHTVNTVAEIEDQFARLPSETQLSLLERLRHRAHVGLTEANAAWEAQLAQMAADPQIKRELADINAEFAAAEADGLGKT